MAEQVEAARTHIDDMSRRRRFWPSTIRRLLCDVVTLTGLALTPRAQLAAENLFLRKQLALYQERCVKPRRADAATRVILVLLSRLLERALAPDGGPARHADSLAPPGLATVLAVDISARPPADSCRPETTDRRDGTGEPDLGRAADRQ